MCQTYWAFAFAPARARPLLEASRNAFPPPFYYFDDDGRIEGTLIHSIPNRPKLAKRDRLDEFKTWANEKHPGLIDELLPNDQIDPTRLKCKLWQQHLLEWRADLGLGNPLLERAP